MYLSETAEVLYIVRRQFVGGRPGQNWNLCRYVQLVSTNSIDWWYKDTSARVADGNNVEGEAHNHLPAALIESDKVPLRLLSGLHHKHTITNAVACHSVLC